MYVKATGRLASPFRMNPGCFLVLGESGLNLKRGISPNRDMAVTSQGRWKGESFTN